MSFEQSIGAGATLAFEKAMTFEGDNPTIIYGNWEYVVQTWITSDTEEIPWPGTGEWQTATVVWNDSVNQKVFIKDRIFCWGTGLCDANQEALDRMGNADLLNFMNTYIDEMFIDLPAVEEMIAPFLDMGFETLSQDDYTVRVSSDLQSGCRFEQWVQWCENGKIPEEEPNWRV
jgi:hypothetical protein